MPINQNSVKATIFKFLKTNGYSPTMLDSSGKEMAITDDADVFQFNFVKDNENYGTITIGIDGTGQLTLYFGDEVATSPAASSQDGMPSFHELTSRLRKLTFGKVSKFELSDMDNLKYDMAKRENTKKLDEGYYPMGKSGSYSDAVPTVKMVIKHTRKIEEGEQRYRNIAQIFIENSLGERVLAPTTKPGLARPFARHIAEGGLPNDDRWNHIKELCEDYTKMAGFVRATKNGQFNESTQQLVSEGTAHYVHLRESLRKMAGKRGYTEHFDNWSPTLVEDAAGTDLSEMFMNATLDPRIESAMPILAKISKNTSKMAEVDELSEWADHLVSEELAPKSIPQIDDLAKLLSNDIVVGPNAMYAKEMLASANLIDDELNAQLEELAERDSDANATDTIINWMEQSADHRMHSVLDKIEPAELGADVDESLRPGEHHGFEDDPITGTRVYKGIQGDQYQAPKKPHEWKDNDQARAQRQHDREEPKLSVAEASMAPNARIDPQSTTQYGMKIVNALNQQFGDYFSYKMNQDGSFTVVQKKGSGPENQYDPRYENDPNVLTPQSVSRVLDPYYNMFRQKGWRFDQPMGGEFTISIPEDQAVSEDLTAKKRKEQERGQQPIEPKDQQVGVAKVTKGVAEVSESKDNLISTLNSFGYYTDDSRVYVNDDGDKIVRVGSEWKHQSGKRGRGAEELGDFLSSNQAVSEDLDANQQRVGQLGPKAKHAKPGDLVGVDESTDQLTAMRRLSGLIK